MSKSIYEEAVETLNQIKDIINRPINRNYDYYIAIINKYFEIENIIKDLEAWNTHMRLKNGVA